jgi:hypothetical protein
MEALLDQVVAGSDRQDGGGRHYDGGTHSGGLMKEAAQQRTKGM